MAAVAGLVPCAESGMRTFLRGSPRDFEQRAHQQDAGQLAVRAGGGLQGHGVHAGDLRPAPLRAAPSLPSRPAKAAAAGRDAPRPGPSVRATSSFTRGLYFMVQEPSGYMPRSMA